MVPVWWVEPPWFEQERHAAFRTATLAWLESLDLDPHRLAPTAAVIPYGGGYELHVDEILRDVRGGDRVDPLAVDKLLTMRRIVPVEAESWPAMPSIEELAA